MGEGDCCASGSCGSGDKKAEDGCRSPPAATSHDHVHHHQNHDHKDDTSLCLAVIREHGADVVIFDKSGRPRAFSYEGGDLRQLCFDTHGSDAELTPCFDNNGNHGVPEESCFCGVDTPHLHAHLKDPKTCNANTRDVHLLANQTLHPTDTAGGTTSEEFSSDDESVLMHLDVSECMPKECNYQQVKSHTNSSGKPVVTAKRLHKVVHDDHVDYLVHHPETGSLHLAHPCQDCGHDDVHGQFQNVGQRRLKRRSDVQVHFFEVSQRPFNILDHIQDLFQPQSDRVAAVENIMKPKLSSPLRKPSSSKEIKPVRSTLHCSGICCSAEVPAVTKIVESIPGVKKVMINVPLRQVLVDHDPRTVTASEIAAVLSKNNFSSTVKRDGGEAKVAVTAALVEETGRSAFYVEGICCASEIPVINSILEPIRGVSSVSINTTTKTVYVNHNLAVVSAQQLVDALNAESFVAEIRHDASTTLSANSAFVRSILTFDEKGPETEGLTAFLRTYDPSQMESFVVDVPAKTITVVHNPFVLSAQDIATALHEKTEFAVQVSSDGSDPESWAKLAADGTDIEGLQNDERFTWPRPNVIISGVCWIVSMLSYIGGNWSYLRYVGILGVVTGLPPIALKAYRTLRRWQFDTNCLMLFASLGAVALQEYPEAAAVVFLFASSEWLEVRATTRARRALSAIVQLRPDKANIIHPTTKELVVVPAACVPVGALVSVMTGDKVPCDGVVVAGASTVDESSLTGESRPVRKGPSDFVSGGTLNSGLTPLTVRTTSTSENSAVSRLIRLVEEAQANRSATEKLVDEFAKFYTPVILFAAILMMSIPWAFGYETGFLWTNNGLVLIVIACPCALIISTPVSYVAGLAAAAQKGVLIKGGAHLEALGLVKQICLDKTGTLTEGNFSLLYLDLTSEMMTRQEALQYLCLMEESASHPIAHAILKAAQIENVAIPRDLRLVDHAILEGEGVQGIVNGVDVFVGNERLFDRLGLLNTLSESDKQKVESWKAFGGTIGFMAVGDLGIVCAFCAADVIRPEAAKVVKDLKSSGMTICMLTGDNREAAFAIGQQVGLVPEEVRYRLLPEEKLSFVENLSVSTENMSLLYNPCSKRRFVLFCGDGVNDAPALAAADVGVAMGAGATLAMETADVTLLDSNLEKLSFSIMMGRRVINKIKQNIVFSIVVKLVVLGFALAGRTNLWAAIGTDVGSMILVTLNAMLLLPPRQRRTDVQGLKTDIEKGTITRSSVSRQPAPLGARLISSKVQSVESACKDGCCADKPALVPVDKGLIDSSAVTVKTSCKKGCCSSSLGLEPETVTTTTAKSRSEGCGRSSGSSNDNQSNKTPSETKRAGCGHSHEHGHHHIHSDKMKKKAAGSIHAHSHEDSARPAKSEGSGHSHEHGHQHSHKVGVEAVSLLKEDSSAMDSADSGGAGHAHGHTHNRSAHTARTEQTRSSQDSAAKLSDSVSSGHSHEHGHGHTHH